MKLLVTGYNEEGKKTFETLEKIFVDVECQLDYRLTEIKAKYPSCFRITFDLFPARIFENDTGKTLTGAPLRRLEGGRAEPHRNET